MTVRRFAPLAACLLALASIPSTLRAADKDESKPAPKVSTWAHIEIKGAYPEGSTLPGLFGELQESLDAGLGRLRRAADDSEIEGVLLHIKGPSIGWAKLNEFRQAIAKVRAAGRPVHAWMDSPTTKDYLLATACDKIAIPESGILMMPGIRSEVTFYKNLFDKLSIEPQILRVGEFKSAAEPYSRTEMSGPFREEMEAILDDYHQQMLQMIADSREISVEKAGELVDRGVLTAAEAREAGLVDVIAYEEEFQKSLPADSDAKLKLVMGYGKKKLDTDFSGFNGFIKMMNLLAGVEPQQRKSKTAKIAVISAVGVIMPGKSQSDLLGTEVLGSETLIKAIREARDDDTVKAIVLRIDSPGGSALASDLMWHELEVVGKPVIASMGDTAASGGYYIAMGADRIIAEPGTLTGSIGVVGGKIAFEGLFEKVGVNTSVVQRGKNAGILSMTMPFSESERAAMQKLLDDIYRQFTSKAADGRKMEVDKLEKLARGRVYTGNQALEIGLVDELGTLEDAIAAAKKAAKIPEGDKVEKLQLPKAVSPLEQLFGPLEETTSLRSAGRASLADLLPASLQNILEAVSLSDLLARERILTVLPYKVQID